MPAPEIYDPNFVIVKRYNFTSDDHVDNEYYKELDLLFEEIIKDLIRKKLLNQISSFGLIQTPLEKMEREIAPIIIEESKKIVGHSYNESNECALAQAEFESVIYFAAQQSSITPDMSQRIKTMLTSPKYQIYKKHFSQRMTPLIIAIKMGSLPLVKFLLSMPEFDAEFNLKGLNGHTALYWAKMISASVNGKCIFDFLITYVQSNVCLFDSMSPMDMALLSTVDDVKPIIIKKFSEKLSQKNNELVVFGRELIKNINEVEFKLITSKILNELEVEKNHKSLEALLNLLKFVVIKESCDSEMIQKILNISFTYSQSKVIAIKKIVLDLQNTIGKRLLEVNIGLQREKYDKFQMFIYDLDPIAIKTIYLQAEEMLKTNSSDLHEFAILIFDSIIRNYKANRLILENYFLVIKKFVNSNDVSRQIDIINLFRLLMHLNSKYDLQISETGSILIRCIYTNSIDCTKKFDNLPTWQQTKLLHGLLNILEHLINKQCLDSSFIRMAEVITNKIKALNKE